MVPRIRLRMALLVVALSAIAFAFALMLWQRGTFPLQYEHAKVAREHSRRWMHYSRKLRYSRRLAAAYPPGAVVPAGVTGTPEEFQAAVVELEAKVREEAAIVDYHARIAGPSYRWWVFDGSSK
jgi:hypothetical protein